MSGRSAIIPVRFLALLLLVLTPSACATRREGPDVGGGGNTVLIVDNNIIPSTQIRVYAITPSGDRSLVGFASPSRITTLRFTPAARAGEYRFVAETAGGEIVARTPVSFEAGATIEWDLERNIARIAAPR